MSYRDRTAGARRAFTLAELLVVVAIIVILLAILIPVVSRVQHSAKEASTKALISELTAAIEQYYQDYRAYPGPLANEQLWTAAPGNLTPAGIRDTNNTLLSDRSQITGAENMVLGLLGGLRLVQQGTNTFIAFDPDIVGNGPNSLNEADPGRRPPYIANVSLSKGSFSDGLAAARDSRIPEIVDRFNNPLPVLYLRARVNATMIGNTPSSSDNPVITYAVAGNPLRRVGAYQLEDIIAYTGAFLGSSPTFSIPPPDTAASIGEGKDLPEVCYDGTGNMVSWKNKRAFHGLRTMPDIRAVLSINDLPKISGSRYYYPYNAMPYFRDSNFGDQADPRTWVPKKKDAYILISAGKDRVYGTDDDITNFGAVAGQ